MYRWQDPAPEAVKAIKARRSARVCVPEFVEVTEPSAPVLTVDGVEYVEAPEVSEHDCAGCVADRNGVLCGEILTEARKALGRVCIGRRVIYLRKG